VAIVDFVNTGMTASQLSVSRAGDTSDAHCVNTFATKVCKAVCNAVGANIEIFWKAVSDQMASFTCGHTPELLITPLH
jgi:hypothetical protein